MRRFRMTRMLTGCLSMVLPAVATAGPVNCTEILNHMRNGSWAIQGWPAPFKVTFRVWEPFEISAAEARRRLRAIEGLPDHPDREPLERALAAASAEGWSDPETIWYFDDKRLRYQTVDTVSRPGHSSHIDIGVDGDSYWTLSNNTLTLVRSRTAPDNLNQRRFVHRMLESVLGVAAAPGLYAHLNDVLLESCESDGRAWTATWTRENGRTRLRTRGTVASDGEMLTTEVRALLVGGDSPSGTGGTAFLRHEYSDIFSRSIPRLIRIGPESNPSRMYEILEIARVDPSEANGLVRQPEQGVDDPIRGRIAFDTISDWRSGSPQVRVWAANDGWIAPTNAPQSRNDPGRTLPIFLIAMAAIALGVGAFLRFSVRR